MENVTQASAHDLISTTEPTPESNATELNAEPPPEYIAHKKKANVTELNAEPAQKRKKNGVVVVAIPSTLLHLLYTCIYTYTKPLN